MECIRWHESKKIYVELFSEMFCAGHSDGHQDACLGKLHIIQVTKKIIINLSQGDSGGPLIIKDRGRFFLVGITSAGFGCGVPFQPGIYHNVQKTSSWILDIINRNIV